MMGKRSQFKKRKNDAYMTWDTRAVTPLLPHLTNRNFCEPCAGAGDLVFNLQQKGFICDKATDISPQFSTMTTKDCFKVVKFWSQIITNPPWTREILHPMINHFINTCDDDVWLLFDADWAYTKQKPLAKRTGCKTVPELLEHCHSIVSVGRLRWIKDSPYDAKDNCAWYGFSKEKTVTAFYGRV